MKTEIDWRKGSVSMITSMLICILMFLLLLLFMLFVNLNYASTLAATRTDVMSDSIAVYSQSFDYNYNKSKAETMLELLTKYNNEASDFYTIKTTVDFPEDNQLTVSAIVETPSYYPSVYGFDTVTSRASATVTSVDIWGDIFVVPSDLGQNNHDRGDTTPNPGAADIVT